MLLRKASWVRAGMALFALIVGATVAAAPVEITFYYPVAIGGSATKIVDDLVADFEKANPDIKVKPVYAGTYQEAIGKALTASKAGQPPDAAVILAADMFSLIDEGVILPFDTFVKTDEDRRWFNGFFPVYMLNSQYGGKTWGIPFQRGTTLFFWNKEAFKEAGLDPEKGPQTWEEVVEFAKKLTKRDASGNVTQWGMQVPSSLTSYWLLQGYVAQNNGRLSELSGDKTYFDSPEVIEALQYWVDLSAKHKVMKPGVIEWGTNAKDFFERRTAMVTTTSGNLTNVKNNAPFPFGVQILPAHKKRGAPTSGGNFYLFKTSSPEKQAATFRMIKWLTSADRSAEWSIKTGYVAPRPDAWETTALKNYVAEFPGAKVAYSQLQYLAPELATHANQRVARAIDDGIEAALTGKKTPEQAMRDAQREADRILSRFR